MNNDPLRENSFTTALYKFTEGIREKFGLDLDQLGELDAEIIDIFTGYSKSVDFIAHIMERLDIDTDTARRIAQEVNTGIFEVYKNKMKTESAMASKTISSVEKAGGFEIEREEAPAMSDEEAASDSAPSGLPDRVNLMGKSKESEADPLVNQLLKQSAAVPEGKNEVKSDDPDPYRESPQ